MTTSALSVPVSPLSQAAMNDEWRQHGKARRMAAVEEDVNRCGASFPVNPKCDVHHYFEISDRVFKQFRGLCTSRRDLDQIYVMGCRLERFISESLPKHPEYSSIESSVTALREKMQNRLKWIRERLELIALRIDEEELNKHILKDLESEADPCFKEATAETSSDTSETQESFLDDSTFEKEATDNSDENHEWESFSGWTSNVSLVENTWYDADGVSFDGSATLKSDSRISESISFVQESPERQPLPCDSPSITEYYVSASSSDEESSVDDHETSFLDEIATQEVEYEHDSEAVDSWAQEVESCARLSSSVSGPHEDAARATFHAIMNNLSLIDKGAESNGLEDSEKRQQGGTWGKADRVSVAVAGAPQVDM